MFWTFRNLLRHFENWNSFHARLNECARSRTTPNYSQINNCYWNDIYFYRLFGSARARFTQQIQQQQRSKKSLLACAAWNMKNEWNIWDTLGEASSWWTSVFLLVHQIGMHVKTPKWPFRRWEAKMQLKTAHLLNQWHNQFGSEKKKDKSEGRERKIRAKMQRYKWHSVNFFALMMRWIFLERAKNLENLR